MSFIILFNYNSNSKLADKYIKITRQESLAYAINNIENCLQTELTNLEESLVAERIVAQTARERKIKEVEKAKVIASPTKPFPITPTLNFFIKILNLC